MTDAEIIKALECCSTYGMSCKHCPAFVKVDRSKCREVLMGAKNLINRLKAENEKLVNIPPKDPIDFCGVVCNYAEELIEKAKSEAVKEFAERLKDKKFEIPVDAYSVGYLFGTEDIDDILEEMGYTNDVKD